MANRPRACDPGGRALGFGARRPGFDSQSTYPSIIGKMSHLFQLYCTLQGCPRMQRAVWNSRLSPGRALRTPRAGDVRLGLHYGHTAPFPGVPNLLGQGCVCEQPELARVTTPAPIFFKKLVPPRSLLIDA